jgi:hypothetical protein
MAIATPRLMHQEWAENRLADFNLWASSAGTYATGKASLDYRLRENVDVNLLSMLRILVQKCISQGKVRAFKVSSLADAHLIAR